MHFVNWSRHQDTVKVKDQDVAGIRVKSEVSWRLEFGRVLLVSQPMPVKPHKAKWPPNGLDPYIGLMSTNSTLGH